jgi:YVTN family beta-propeller protein
VQIADKIHPIVFFLMILAIMILALVLIFSNNATAQTLHNRTVYEIVKQTSGSDENAQIEVGDAPSAIAVDDFFLGTVYVANFDSDSVSVISRENNTKIGEDIRVGESPAAIDVNYYSAINETIDTRVYVANYDSDSVSVISVENNTRIKDIPVGVGPIAIDIDDIENRVYVANFDSNRVSVIDPSTNTKIGEDIRVGVGPADIDVNPNSGMVYVANKGSDSVSVIDPSTNTKIGEDIRVGVGPIAIDISRNSGMVYVANYDSDSVSVIDPSTNTKIGEDIPVGESPAAIGIGTVSFNMNNTQLSDTIVYVANYDSDSVSVIDPSTNTKIGEDIRVGDSPVAIGIDHAYTIVYVANYDSDSVSVIDGITNKVVAGVTFNVNPFNSGYIVCEDLSTPSEDDLADPSPTGQYIYVYSGSQCMAKPNEGFEFVSWEENNLKANSTQLISVSRSASTWDSILDFFGIKSDEPEATIPLTKFGTFTANFKELPPAVPSEYWIPLYGIIISTIVGWSIPSIIGWTKSKRDVRKLNYYHKQIASLYGDGKLDENDIEALDRLRSRVSDAYAEGKINDKHYETLRGEISTLYEEIFRKKIATLDSNNNYSVVKKPIQQQLAQIRNEVELAFSKGKINEMHYDLLNKAISNLDSKERESS